MKHLARLLGVATLVCVGSLLHAQGFRTDPSVPSVLEPAAAQAVTEYSRARLDRDLAMVQMFRPAYPFWQYIYDSRRAHCVRQRSGRTVAGDLSNDR